MNLSIRPIREKLADIGIVLLIVYTAISCVHQSAHKYFWSDEIITVALTRQPSLRSMLSALENAADSHPPPFYVLERLAAHLPVNELIAFRLPSILAFCGVILCVFLFIRKTRGAMCALVCATILLLSALYYPFAVEARGYGLMTGFAALAMVSYQRADKKRWCILLGLSFAAATASHYYAVFAAFPFALAEGVLIAKNCRLRLGVWLALLASVLPIVIFWPLLQILKRTYGSDFHGHLSTLEVVRSYGFMWNLRPLLGLIVAVTTLVAILIFGFFWRKETLCNIADEVSLQGQEQGHVIALGFVILPAVMGVAFAALHSGFLYRYAILAVLGFPLAVSYLLSAVARPVAVVLSIFIFAGLGAQEWGLRAHFWFPNKAASIESIERFVNSAGYDELPLVVSDPTTYMQIAYYVSPKANRRIVYLSDPQSARAYLGSGNGDTCVRALQPYFALQLDGFSNFVSSHRQFLIYVDSSDIWGWVQTRMLDDGYALDIVAQDREKRIYRVHPKS